MGGDRRATDGRTPPSLEGLTIEDGQCRLSLEAHRDLLVDITGVEPTGELTLRELETIRARLEGYVEREKRMSAETVEPTEPETTQERSTDGPIGRLFARLMAYVSLVGPSRARGSSERRTEPQGSYSVETVQQLAQVFRAAIDARRAEIAATDATLTVDATATAGSSADAAAD